MVNSALGTSILDVPLHLLTPGMKQYREAKEANPDCLIMLRMGDFYEMFYQDAEIAARDLEITLTKRGKGEKTAPLAGVPYHALETYLGRLVQKGHKVAIIEQLEDPKKAKGLVKRGLVRIVTKGTLIESNLLDATTNNYIFALLVQGEEYNYALADLSTGEFLTGSLNNEDLILAEMQRRAIAECLVPESLLVNQELINQIKKIGATVNSYPDYYFKPDTASKILHEQFNVKSLKAFGLEEQKEKKKGSREKEGNNTNEIRVAGALFNYLLETQKKSLSHFKRIKQVKHSDIMQLDRSTLLNLELLTNMRNISEQGKLGAKGTLLSVIDKTITVLGKRMLKRIIKEPLLKKEKIKQRLDAVEELNQKVLQREDVKTLLKNVYDLERLIGRINYGNASPRDLLALRDTLLQLPYIQQELLKCNSQLIKEIKELPNLAEVYNLINNAIREDAPITIREGGFIKAEFNKELQELVSIKTNAKQFLAQIEEREKEKLGITTGLKVGFNRVFGYFIEVTKKNTSLVPETYIRKQTTANAERYITEELKIEEDKILGAEEKIKVLEYNIFQQILDAAKQHTKIIQETANKIALLDVLCSFSSCATEYNYCKPTLLDNKDPHSLQIIDGRHPVVERIEENFIPNSIKLEQGEIMIITGPNTSGKSTVMRQTALIVLMAQIGSFVPASSATLSIVDRIFTRVGAHDDLAAGQSTFMVEMLETANILNNATEKSLIILDEIGRGTSTFDGVSIAWSTAEHIYNHIKAKTLFATHYHVLNKLEDRFEKISNYNIAVKEIAGEVIFLRKLVHGGTDQSHGVHVAKLAGMPASVVQRAREIQRALEAEDEMVKKIKAKKMHEQMSLEKF